MDKKLPKVFANVTNKDFHNNERIYVSKGENEEIKKDLKKDSIHLQEMNVGQKIRTIFNSKNYIYKADVEVTQKGEKKIKKIIGKNGNYLITIDNEMIPIETIEDIKLIN